MIGINKIMFIYCQDNLAWGDFMPELNIYLPITRDSIRAKESFQEWGHQAMIPFVGDCLFNFILKDIIFALKGIEDINGKINILCREDETGKTIEDNIIHLQEYIKGNNVLIEVDRKEYYTYFGNVLRLLSSAIEYEDGSSRAYVVHYPNVILKNERYHEFFSNVKDYLLNSSNPRILIVVYIYEIESPKSSLNDKFKLVDVLPSSNISAAVYSPFNKYLSENYVLPAPGKDYFVLEKDGKKYLARFLGIYGVNREIMDIMKNFIGVDVTSEYKFLEFLKQIYLTWDDVDIMFMPVSDGDFVFVKYPWEILRGVDYISRWTTYRWVTSELRGRGKDKRENKMYVDWILKYVDNKKGEEFKYTPIVIYSPMDQTSTVSLEFFSRYIKDNHESIKKALKDLEKLGITINYRYSFEEYPYDEKTVFSSNPAPRKDLIEELFRRLKIRGILFIPSETETDEMSSAEELLDNAGIVIEDLNTTLIRGIVFIGKGTQINPGAHIRNSIIGANVTVMTKAIVDHSIIGDGTIIYPDSIITYAIVGVKARIAANVTFAREKFREDGISVHQFFTGRDIVTYTSRFSALIGDSSELMIGVTVNPGRRIGHHCKVYPNLTVKYNLPPRIIMEDERILTAYYR